MEVRAGWPERGQSCPKLPATSRLEADLEIVLATELSFADGVGRVGHCCYQGLTMPIDVWDASTFDDVLLAVLRQESDLIRNYLFTARAHYLEREASDHTRPYPLNPFGAEYVDFVDGLAPIMQKRTIRAWHYTRLTDLEVTDLRHGGVYMSDLSTIRRRLDAQVKLGAFSSRTADALFAGSPFQSDQRDSRSNKLWMVSHPLPIDDGGVELLLESWGGEAIYFWQRDQDLCTLLKSIGQARVIELAVPIAATDHAYGSARAVVATFARKLGCHADSAIFDLYVSQPLSPTAILAVHSEEDANFGRIGLSYPIAWADVVSRRS